MYFQEFSEFGDGAQLWIYPFRDPINEDGASLVKKTLGQFLPNWVSHGVPVEGKFRIHENHFVLLVGQSTAGISGCSIDSSVNNFKDLRDHYGLDGLDRSLVFFRNEKGVIQSRHFQDFQKLVKSGLIDPETNIFDTTITTLGQLRQGKFENPLLDSSYASRFIRFSS